jgi:hypothetical protein
MLAAQGQDLDSFLEDATTAGLGLEARFATWGLRPFTPAAQFLVAVLARV